MSKLIFFDIDGTLIMPGCSPRPAVLQAIRAARSKGHKVFLSTGRLECDVPGCISAIGFDGGIYSAGGRAVVGSKTVLDQPLSGNLIRQITEALRDENLFYILETRSGAYSGQSWEGYPYITHQRYAVMKSSLHLFEPEERPADVPIYKIVFIAPPETDLRPLIDRLGSAARVVVFPGCADISGEISSPEHHKGKALLHICRHLKTSPKDCVAFGDSMNDAEILHTAGLGIAVGNADDDLKRIADEVCGSFAEDGIAIALKKMQLI